MHPEINGGITQHQPQTIVTQLYQQAYAPFFGSGPPPYVPFLVDPSLATDVRDLWVDMGTTFDPNYGESIVYSSDPFPSIRLLQPSKVIFHLDNSKFYAFYVDLLTRPAPVTFDREPSSEGNTGGDAVSLSVILTLFPGTTMAMDRMRDKPGLQKVPASTRDLPGSRVRKLSRLYLRSSNLVKVVGPTRSFSPILGAGRQGSG